MGIKNPVIRKGTEGSSTFLQVTSFDIQGIKYWMAIRPLITPRMLGNGQFGIGYGFRVRVEADNHANKANEQGVIQALKAGVSDQANTFKANPTYGSYMIGGNVQGKVDSTAHAAISLMKSDYAALINKVLNHAEAHASLEHHRDDIINYLMAALDKGCAKLHIDIGDLDPNNKAPETQQFVADYEKGKAAHKSTTAQLGGKPADKAKPEEKPEMTQEQKDQYAEQQKADLSDLSFDDLMGAISKKNKGGSDES